ncbi:MAG: 3-hydroxyisobutyrate dehydrogenase [Gammaproteobacteria bacterium AqS3]|nr:3-hydroxyisobutyrate dehydrogenase [Gammaproteobacteria bacterium AqS3]
MKTVHFIGLGNMGLPMALNLKAARAVQVYDISERARTAAGAAGLEVLGDDAVGIGADALISMLPAGEHVRSAVIESGLVGRLNAGALLIDCSTADRDTALALAECAREHGCGAIDSPVSGGIRAAEAGTLTFMCGGEAGDIERARPLLEAMGSRVFHAGDTGSGQSAKMCNNMLLAICMAGTCEALNLGHRLGLDEAVLSEIMHQASGANWALDCYNPWPGVMEGAVAGADYRGGFKSDLMLKDLSLAGAAADQSGSVLHLGALVRALYERHCEAGGGELDFGSILRLYREDS